MSVFFSKILDYVLGLRWLSTKCNENAIIIIFGGFKVKVYGRTNSSVLLIKYKDWNITTDFEVFEI